MRFAAKTHTGKVREINEDCVVACVNDGFALFAVADGMGGHQCGEVASALAARELTRGAMAASFAPGAQQHRMRELFQSANRSVYETAVSDPACHGMGTTLTAAYVQGGQVYLGHVGDSRAYVLRAGVLHQITYDHSYIAELVRMGQITQEQAKTHPGRNIITRALGAEAGLQVDTDELSMHAGDVYLICSDGLTNMLDDGSIKDILGADAPLEEMAGRLLDGANANGGVDNISAVLFAPDEGDLA